MVSTEGVTVEVKEVATVVVMLGEMVVDMVVEVAMVVVVVEQLQEETGVVHMEVVVDKEVVQEEYMVVDMVAVEVLAQGVEVPTMVELDMLAVVEAVKVAVMVDISHDDPIPSIYLLTSSTAVLVTLKSRVTTVRGCYKY